MNKYGLFIITNMFLLYLIQPIVIIVTMYLTRISDVRVVKSADLAELKNKIKELLAKEIKMPYMEVLIV